MPVNNRVLIVDDSTLIRTSVSVLLKQNGLIPYTATNGVEGLVAIREKDPGIIISDLEMPEMNGMEMIAMLRGNESTQEIPIIVLTGFDVQREDLVKLTKMGVGTILKKPYKSSELLDKVKRIISDRASVLVAEPEAANS